MANESHEEHEDKSEFRCMYCHHANLKYHPFTGTLPPEDCYIAETPEGGVWIDTYEEEGYLCEVCGAHCTTEEVYWWSPGEPDYWDDEGKDDAKLY